MYSIRFSETWLRIILHFAAGQSFSRDNDNNLSGNIGGYFSNAPSNHIGDSADIGKNRQNGNGGYQY